MKKNCLIIGSTGFIGSSIVRDNFFKKRYNLIKYNRKNLSLLNKEKTTKSLKKQIFGSIIIFTAGKHRLYGDTKTIKNYNIKILNDFVSYLKKCTPQKFFFLSTVEVYGSKKRKKKISENSETKPLNNYAHGKLVQESILKKYCKRNKVEYCILRLPGVYGKRDKNTSVVSKIFNSFGRENFNLYGTGNEKRDYLYIKDLIQLIFQLSIRKKIPKLINVVSGKSFSIKQIIEIFEKKTKMKINLTTSKDLKKSNNFDLNFDTKKLKKFNLQNIIKPFNKNIMRYKKFND